MTLNKNLVSLCAAVALLITACNTNTSINSLNTDDPVLNTGSETAGLMMANTNRKVSLGSIDDMQELNQKLAAKGLNIRVAYAETVTLKSVTSGKKAKKKGKKVGGKQQAGGQIIFAKNRNLRISSQWVPGDRRRLGDANNLTYSIYEPLDVANFGTAQAVDSEPQIDASFGTWEHVKHNQKLDIVKVPSPNTLPSIILGSFRPTFPDISEVGFLPALFFETFLGPGASESVLAVTFTFVFIDGNGNPTDINNDGYSDTAFKEVWYNDRFLWTADKNETGVDIQTVALHENGHALGFGHFGKIFITRGNGKLHVAPRAVMNAIILGPQRELLGTDKASYSSIYGDWPKD